MVVVKNMSFLGEKVKYSDTFCDGSGKNASLYSEKVTSSLFSGMAIDSNG
jgi:hypothetical protein